MISENVASGRGIAVSAHPIISANVASGRMIASSACLILSAPTAFAWAIAVSVGASTSAYLFDPDEHHKPSEQTHWTEHFLGCTYKSPAHRIFYKMLLLQLTLADMHLDHIKPLH